MRNQRKCPHPLFLIAESLGGIKRDDPLSGPVVRDRVATTDSCTCFLSKDNVLQAWQCRSGGGNSRNYVIPQQRHFLKVAQAVRECRPSISRHFRNSLRGATGRLAWPAGSKSSKVAECGAITCEYNASVNPLNVTRLIKYYFLHCISIQEVTAKLANAGRDLNEPLKKLGGTARSTGARDFTMQ
ncbi:unnamed protein product [Arctia plantaginis]|uniref:Uncharacterized protein n=1 Tax=Arctia plantaginis TaxID=874455 RepID=A0A8S0Z6A9_ARCPL|nr:unnamed protein product [Arctia plantaginis]